jgi:hypothetical protein
MAKFKVAIDLQMPAHNDPQGHIDNIPQEQSRSTKSSIQEADSRGEIDAGCDDGEEVISGD